MTDKFKDIPTFSPDDVGLPKQAENQKEIPDLSVIIPVYNEEDTVAELLDRVLAEQDASALQIEIIVVNDGSTDHSDEIISCWINAHEGKIDVQYLYQENAGKGAALRNGIAVSHGKAVIVQDADLEYDPHDYARCVKPILDGNEYVVYGSREESNENRIWSSPFFYLGSLSLTAWINLLFNANLTDEATCYKTFHGPLIRTIAASTVRNGFDWEPEVTAKLLRLGIRPHEVPVSYAPRMPEAGKKIRFRDGLVSILEALKWRFASISDLRNSLDSNFADLKKKGVYSLEKTGYCILTIILVCTFFYCPDTFQPSNTSGLLERFACALAVYFGYLGSRIAFSRITSGVFALIYMLFLHYLPTDAPNVYCFISGATLQAYFCAHFLTSGFFPFYFAFIGLCALLSVFVPLHALTMAVIILFLFFQRQYKFQALCIISGITVFVLTAFVVWKMGYIGAPLIEFPAYKCNEVCSGSIMSVASLIFIYFGIFFLYRMVRCAFRYEKDPVPAGTFLFIFFVFLCYPVHPILSVPYSISLAIDLSRFKQ